MTAAKRDAGKPAARKVTKTVASKPKEGQPGDAPPTKPVSQTPPVAEAGPVAVRVDAGQVQVEVAPPAPSGIDRRLYHLINGLPHSAYKGSGGSRGARHW